jgi:glycosyltransferase involved in cell wall biosynthesis
VAYIKDCVESVRRQTYGHWEQIVIDDGSTDGTAEALAAISDPRVRYRSQQHRGIWHLAQTYNDALAEARGEFIAILEGDDLWLPHKLADQVSAMAEDVALVYGTTELLVDDRPSGITIPDPATLREFGLNALNNHPVGAAAYPLLCGLVVPFPCSTLIRKSALVSIGGFQHVEGLGTVDYPTFIQLVRTGRFAYQDQRVALWRRHPRSSAWNNNAQMVDRGYAYAKAFREQHPSILTTDQARRADRGWRRIRDLARLRTGRLALLHGQWNTAMRSFSSTLLRRDVSIALLSAIGFTAAILHRDIEDIYRLAGRVHFARE